MIITNNQKLRETLTKDYPQDNIYSLPVIQSVTVHAGVGKIKEDKEAINKVVELLTMITGQKPVATKARKSVASFKLRSGQIIGFKVTLRNTRAYDFLNKLFNIAVPRIRDFRGLDLKQINRNSFNIGISDPTIFPEVTFDREAHDQGLQVIITFTSEDKVKEVLETLGAKFKQ